MKDCLDNQVKTVLDIPYFDSDFWPTTIEESIEKLNQEEQRPQDVEIIPIIEDENCNVSIESEDATEVSRYCSNYFVAKIKIHISGKCKSASTHENKNSKKTINQQELAKTLMSNCTNLLSMIFSTMEKHNEVIYNNNNNNKMLK
ncbi:unnamed protein product, partial [Rotaria sordida]